jgi:hypothetical protein
MGCVLYELAVGQKAFNNDQAVWAYRQSGGWACELPLDDSLNEFLTQALTTNIVRMLQIESQARPSVSQLFQEFSQCCQPEIIQATRRRADDEEASMRLAATMWAKDKAREDARQEAKYRQFSERREKLAGEGLSNPLFGKRGSLEIVVQGPFGRRDSFKVEPYTSVDLVKALSDEKEGWSVNDTRLGFRGRNLKDGFVLSDYSIKNRDVLDWIVPRFDMMGT